MILIETDRNLFLNKNPVYVLPGIYVEIGQKWLMAICSESFLGPTRFNSLHHKYYDRVGEYVMPQYVIMLLFRLGMASHKSE